MSNISDEIDRKIVSNSSDIKSIEVKPLNRGKKGGLLSVFFKTLCSFIGVDIDAIKEGKETNGGKYAGGSTSGNNPPPPTPPGGGPSRGGFDPYRYNPVAIDNARIYLQGQDGKGDNDYRGCNCDHDHDNR